MKSLGLLASALFISFVSSHGAESLPKAYIDGTGPGWQTLSQKDFTNVNCNADTWTWGDNLIKCTGSPVGVIRSTQQITNIELVVEWRHLKAGGNSGVFLWATPESIKALEDGKGRLPTGI